MRNRYIAPTIMLFAGAITIILNIVNGLEFYDSMKRLLLVLVIFYIIGRTAAMIILKVTNKDSFVDTDKNQEEPLSDKVVEDKSE